MCLIDARARTNKKITRKKLVASENVPSRMRSSFTVIYSLCSFWRIFMHVTCITSFTINVNGNCFSLPIFANFTFFFSISFSCHFQLYTNWANHYLEKVKSKRRVTDLAVDCRDGLLLADVVEGVTSVKVPDLIRKPKAQQQMVSSNNNNSFKFTERSKWHIDFPLIFRPIALNI